MIQQKHSLKTNKQKVKQWQKYSWKEYSAVTELSYLYCDIKSITFNMSYLSIYAGFLDWNSRMKKECWLEQHLGYFLQSSQIRKEPEGQKRT